MNGRLSQQTRACRGSLPGGACPGSPHTFQDRLVRGENPGVPTGRGADVQMELDAVLQLQPASLRLLEDGLGLVISAAERKEGAESSARPRAVGAQPVSLVVIFNGQAEAGAGTGSTRLR